MKKLNQKLFAVAFFSALVLIALICYFGFNGYSILPQWGLISLIVVGGVMTISMLLFIIRKLTGAERYY